MECCVRSLLALYLSLAKVMLLYTCWTRAFYHKLGKWFFGDLGKMLLKLFF